MSISSSLESLPRLPSPKIDGSFPFLPEEIFRPGLVGEICQKIYGEKADAKLADVLDCSDRTVRDYFSGKTAMPSALLARINFVLTLRPSE